MKSFAAFILYILATTFTIDLSDMSHWALILESALIQSHDESVLFNVDLTLCVCLCVYKDVFFYNFE